MKSEVNGSDITINLRDLVDELDDNVRKELIRYLVADEKLFSEAIDYVVDGNFHQDDEDGWWSLSPEYLVRLRKKLLPLVPEAMRDLVRQLMMSRDRHKQMERHYRDWAFKLYHAWPDSHYLSRPATPRNFPPHTRVTEEQAQATIDAAGAGEEESDD